MPFLHGATWNYIFSIFLQIVSVYHRYNLKKLTYEERKAKLVERLNALNSAADDEDDEWNIDAWALMSVFRGTQATFEFLFET